MVLRACVGVGRVEDGEATCTMFCIDEQCVDEQSTTTGRQYASTHEHGILVLEPMHVYGTEMHPSSEVA